MRFAASLGRISLSLTLSLVFSLGTIVIPVERILATESPVDTGTTTQNIKGTVVMIAEGAWVVRDENGKGTLLRVTRDTKIEGTVAVGDVVEVQASPDGRTLAIKKVR